MSYLDEIAERKKAGKESDTELLYELKTAFDEAATKTSGALPEPMRGFYDLLRFCCNLDSIAPLLRDEPHVIRQALAFAEKHHAKKLVAILTDALSGKPRPKISLIASLFGQKKKLEVEEPEATQFDGKSWGSTDMAISLAIDDFEHALLDEILDNRETLDLQAPLFRRQQAEIGVAVAEKLATAGEAKPIFLELVGGRNCCMLAGSYEDEKIRNTANAKTFSVTHMANPPALPETLSCLAVEYGPAAEPLLAIHACHDGGSLFIVDGEPGFCLASIDEWDVLKEEVLSWAREVTWQDDHDAIPRYLHSAVAFGQIPGDSESWLLITEGEHAGKIMLSDTDVIDDEPRFNSLAEFFATLLCDPARIINCGGYVHYEEKDNEEPLLPIAYRYD